MTVTVPEQPFLSPQRTQISLFGATPAGVPAGQPIAQAGISLAVVLIIGRER
jgi:hypothetical protein